MMANLAPKALRKAAGERDRAPAILDIQPAVPRSPRFWERSRRLWLIVIGAAVAMAVIVAAAISIRYRVGR